jgi:RNA polymerase-interacting CarD/CdnL/TRCF family regulator
MSETKEYFEILGELIEKLKKHITWKKTSEKVYCVLQSGTIRVYKTVLRDLIKETEKKILDRNYYELYLDEERARKQEEYNTWKDENKEQVES